MYGCECFRGDVRYVSELERPFDGERKKGG